MKQSKGNELNKDNILKSIKILCATVCDDFISTYTDNDDFYTTYNVGKIDNKDVTIIIKNHSERYDDEEPQH